MNFVNYTETNLDNSNIEELKRKKVSCELKPKEDFPEKYHQTVIEYYLASIQRLSLKIEKSKYTKDSVDLFSNILLKIFSDDYSLRHERIAIISKYK